MYLQQHPYSRGKQTQNFWQKDPRGLNPWRLLADVNIYFWKCLHAGPSIIGGEAWCEKSKFGPFEPDKIMKISPNSSGWNQANAPNSKFRPDYASGLKNQKNCPDQLIRPQKMLQESGWHSKSLLHWKTVLSSDEQASEVLLKIELWISNNNEHKLVQYLSISVLQTQS